MGKTMLTSFRFCIIPPIIVYIFASYFIWLSSYHMSQSCICIFLGKCWILCVIQLILCYIGPIHVDPYTFGGGGILKKGIFCTLVNFIFKHLWMTPKLFMKSKCLAFNLRKYYHFPAKKPLLKTEKIEK